MAIEMDKGDLQGDWRAREGYRRSKDGTRRSREDIKSLGTCPYSQMRVFEGQSRGLYEHGMGLYGYMRLLQCQRRGLEDKERVYGAVRGAIRL